MRKTLLGGAIVLSLTAWIGFEQFGREAVDPCERTPAIHACAMFLQPEWQRRSVHAGRAALAITPVVTGTATVSVHVPAAAMPAADDSEIPPVEASSDGV